MSYFRVLLRRPARWPVVVPMYRLRECPDCGALVLGDEGQAKHQDHHDELDGGEFDGDEAPVLDGYIIGNGELPAETRIGDD